MTMQLEYDLNVGALYIRLSGEPVARTDEAGSNAAVDLDDRGRVVGIEIISTAGRWPLAGILASYDFDPADAAQLRAYFMPERTASLQDVIPVAEAEPTPSSGVLAGV
jgi:uncharacterized protein YuzE